jgi:sugar O-acyltransferase (sialic acid O-acetyltransferase NeuD family)
MQDLIILGAGGYAQQVFWLATKIGKYNILGFYDETINSGEEKYYQKALITSNFDKFLLKNPNPKIICAVGNISLRRRWVKRFGKNYEFATIIDPSSLISPDAKIGVNVVILGFTVCSIECQIENHVNINWQCLISHHVKVGEFTNISSGVKLTGSASVGRECDIGTNVVVIPKKAVGDRVVLGAGAMVNNNIPSDVTAVGVPAKIIKRHST